MPKLIFRTARGGEESRLLQINEQTPFTIGRMPDNSLQLADSTVSRYHCQIVHEAGRYLLSDTGSARGTLLNGSLISAPLPLKHGDEIRLGTQVVVFSDGGEATDRSIVSETVPNVGGPEVTKDDTIGCLNALYTPEIMLIKRRIYEQIVRRLKPSETAFTQRVDGELRQKVEATLDAVLRELRHELPSEIPLSTLRQALLDELLDYGPISPLLADESVTEVMVNGVNRVFVERRGMMIETGVRFYDDQHLLAIIRRIVEPLGRRIDESSPMLDVRLPDGSRVDAIIPPLALDGPSLTIRKLAMKKITADDLISFGVMTTVMLEFLRESVRSRQCILISGGSGAGKTTFLNIISQFVPQYERIVTVEESGELRLPHRNLVRLEARPANSEGRGYVSIRDLVRYSRHMRADRIIVGECRGGEALDILQAVNTGYDGALTTIHADSPKDALQRLETLVMMAGFELPITAIREQIASAVDLVVQQTRLVDGSRKTTRISEITGRKGDEILMDDIFVYEQTGFGEGGKVKGRFRATGKIPRFVEKLRQEGDLRLDMSIFKDDTTLASEPKGDQM